jgi:hypothetical protein
MRFNYATRFRNFLNKTQVNMKRDLLWEQNNDRCYFMA